MPWIICLAGLDPKFFKSRRACVPFIGCLVVYLDQAPSLDKFSRNGIGPGVGGVSLEQGEYTLKGGGYYRGGMYQGGAYMDVCRVSLEDSYNRSGDIPRVG